MDTKDQKQDIFKEITEFFENEKWTFEKVNDQQILRSSFTGKNGRWLLFAQSLDEQRRVLFYSVMETNVPADRRVEVAECITRANFNLAIGNFEMDFDHGMVRFRTSIDTQGGDLSQTMIRVLVLVNCMMMDNYIPAIMSVTYAETSPAEAIAKISDQTAKDLQAAQQQLQAQNAK